MRSRGVRVAFGFVLAVCPATTGTVARAQATPWTPSRGVVVHIESPETVELQAETGNELDPFYVACTSPCNEAVPSDGRYRISGDSVRPSEPFLLTEGADRDTIVVAPASRVAFALGVASLAVGGLAAAVGFWVLLTSSLADSPDSAGNHTPHDAGLGLAVGGAPTAVVGAVLLVLNAHSKVRQASDTPGRVVSAGWLAAMKGHHEWEGRIRAPISSMTLFEMAF